MNKNDIQYPWQHDTDKDRIAQAIYSGQLDDIQHPGFIVELSVAEAERQGFVQDPTISTATALDGQEVPVWPTKS